MPFTKEQSSFMIESYFRTGVVIGGEYRYNINQSVIDFIGKYPQFERISRDNLKKTIKKFSSLGRIPCINKKKSRPLITSLALPHTKKFTIK